MTNERFLEIAKDKQKCEFCGDVGEENCLECKEVKSITREEVKAFWNIVINLKKKHETATEIICDLCRELAHEKNNICGCYSCAYGERGGRKDGTL